MIAQPARGTMGDIGLCTQHACKEIMRAAMISVVGPAGRHTYSTLADMIDVEERTLQAYAWGETLPSVPVSLRICAIAGPEFTNRFLVLIAQHAVVGSCSDGSAARRG